MSIKGIAWLVLIFVLVNMSFGETATPDLEKADLLYEAGQYNQAQDLYRKVVSESKDYSDVRHGLFQLGQCLTAQGKYVEAIGVFDGLMNKYPNSKEVESALYRKGCILAGFMKDVQRGLECFDELLRRFPGEYGDDALYSIGSIYFARKDYTKAQEAYKKFLSMYPASPYSKVAKENLSEIDKSKGRGLVLSGKPVELEFQGNTYTITKNDSQPVGIATGDGSVYRFNAGLGGAWKTNLHTHGIWMASPDGKELVWLSDQSGVTPLVEPPCPSGGGGGGGPCPCQLPDCVGTISITASPDKVCVNGLEPSYNVVVTGNYVQCDPQPFIDTSTTGTKTATAYACCTDCTGAHTISATSNPVTVYKVASVTLDPGSMSSGGKGSDVHKASVTATTSPAVSGVNISFNIKDGTGQGKNVPASISPSSGTTGADGKVTLNLALKSSDKVESATIVAGCDTQTDKPEVNASFGKPNDGWEGRYPAGGGNFGAVVPYICMGDSEDLRLKLTFPWRSEPTKPVDSHNILFDFLSILDENNVAVLRTAYSQYATLSPTTGITDASGFVTTTLNGIKACTTQVYAIDNDVYTSSTDKATYSSVQVKVIEVKSLAICEPTGPDWNTLLWEQVLQRDESLRIKAGIKPAISQLSDFQCEVKVKTSGTNPTGVNITFDTLTGNGTELRATLNPVSLGLLPSNPADGIPEFTSSDNASGSGSNFNDSNQFDSDMVTTRTQRGKARNGGNQPPISEPLTTMDEGGVSKTYMQAAGVEYIQAEAHNGTVKSLKKQIENESNYLYYSGHGSHSDGSVALYPSGSFLPSDVGSTEWKEDTGSVFFAGCAVLDINDYNNNYTGQAHNASPGELWAPKGPNLWFGYNWIAPLDDNLGNPNYTASIIHNYFVNRNNGENENWSWGKANKDMASTTDRTVPGGRVYNSCVIDMNQNPDEYWYWKYTGNNPPVWAKEAAPW